MSSIASIRTPKGVSYVAYNASKGAVNALTMAIASEYAGKGIRCNAILPGLMHTPMIDFLAEQYAKGETDHNQAYDKMIAIRHKASPTGKMGNGSVNNALLLAQESLKKQGISNPTPDQLKTAVSGILDQRASHKGWGEIAKSMNVKLGDLRRNEKADIHAKDRDRREDRAERRAERAEKPEKPERPEHAARGR